MYICKGVKSQIIIHEFLTDVRNVVFESQVKIIEDAQVYNTAFCFQKFFHSLELYFSLTFFYRTLGKRYFQDLE